MKNKRRIIGIISATLLALVGTISLVGYVRAAKDDAVAQEALVDVYVVDQLVPKGADPDTIITSVSIEQIPARLRQEGAITDLDDVGDLVASTDLQPGDQLVMARLASDGVVTREVTDKVQISTLLDAERAVGGAVQKGDLVGVYMSFEPFDVTTYEFSIDTEQGPADQTEPSPDDSPSAGIVNVEATATDEQIKTPNVTRLEFQHVLVTNVQTINPPVNPIDDEETADVVQVTGTQYVVTLALSPEQSERFVFATEFGEVWLSIDPATVEDDGTRRVELQDVYAEVK